MCKLEGDGVLAAAVEGLDVVDQVAQTIVAILIEVDILAAEFNDLKRENKGIRNHLQSKSIWSKGTHLLGPDGVGTMWHSNDLHPGSIGGTQFPRQIDLQLVVVRGIGQQSGSRHALHAHHYAHGLAGKLLQHSSVDNRAWIKGIHNYSAVY